MEKNCREKKFIEFLVVTLQNNLKDGIIQEILRASPHSGKRMVTVALLSMGYNVNTCGIRQL